MEATEQNYQQNEHTDTKPARCAVILNKGSGTIKELWSEDFKQQLHDAFSSSGWNPTIHHVAGEELEETARQAAKDGVDAIISGGGDGTTKSMSELARELDIPLGILPFGTLNLAARDLGTPIEPLEAARSLKPGHIQSIDALDVNDQLCLCMVVLGFYPKMLEEQEEFHGRAWWLKSFHLARGFMRTYLRASVMDISLKTKEGEIAKLKTRFMCILPGGYRDTAGMLPQRESMVAGQCSVFCSRHKTRWGVAKMAVRFLLGNVKSDPELSEYSADEMTLEIGNKSSVLAAVDGELIKLSVPVKMDLVPRSLKVLKPVTENS